MDYLLCITRNTAELTTLISRRQHNFEPPQRDVVPDWNNLYQTLIVPIAELKPSPLIERLNAAWQRLQAVEQWNVATLVDIIVVLTESVATSEIASLSLPILQIETKPKRSKPTAAHPRAFQGTKYQPPKSKLPEAVNLQVALADPKNQAIALQAVWQYRDKAIQLLCDLGYEPARVHSMTGSATPPADISLLLRHPNVPNQVKSSLLPCAFREEILPLLRELPWHRVEASLELFWQLELYEQVPLRCLVSRFLAISPLSYALDWLQLLANQYREHWLTLLTFAIEHQIADSPCPKGADELLDTLSKYAPVKYYPQWTYTMLGGLKQSISARYLLDGVIIASKFHPNNYFSQLQPCDDFSRTVVEDILYQLLEDKDFDVWWATNAWKAGAKLAGFCQVLAASDWSRLTLKQKKGYFRLLVNCSYSDYEEPAEVARKQANWTLFKKYCSQIEATIRAIPEAYVEQWVGDVNEFILQDIETSILAEVITDAITLATRLAKPPFLTDSCRELVFSGLVQLRDATLRQQVLNAPVESLKCIDKASRRENNAKLISWGLTNLLKELPAFTVTCLYSTPNKLVKTAKQLAPLSWELILKIVQTFAHHPIMTTDFKTLTLPEIDILISALAAAERCNPIPRSLREYFDGKRSLTEAQLERHHRIVLNKLIQTQLQVLEEMAEAALWHGFENAITIPDAKHALQLYRDVHSNKRAFRRFLNAYTTGNTDYLATHPLTLAWIKHHPNIPLALWTRGIRLDSYEQQYLRITMEQKPLEVLKLGTYMGTCLGLGGIMTDSAIAIVLDVNKQVLYARDEKGTVLARQLLAISKEDELVAFEVYPLSISSDIKALFLMYDNRFAEALGIKLFSGDGEYYIEHILSQDWWDDRAWNFTW